MTRGIHDDFDLDSYAFEHSPMPPELRAFNVSPAHQELQELNFDHSETQGFQRSMNYYRAVQKLDRR